jgi:hypothetical protein
LGKKYQVLDTILASRGFGKVIKIPHPAGVRPWRGNRGLDHWVGRGCFFLSLSILDKIVGAFKAGWRSGWLGAGVRNF